MQYRDTARDDAGDPDTYNHTCQLQEPAMSKKLTILIEDSVYEGLHRVVGRGSISKFIENLARPHVAQKDLGAQYREAARDPAREREARAWTEGLIGSVDETR
jgi:predicted CopG family antitoxin